MLHGMQPTNSPEESPMGDMTGSQSPPAVQRGDFHCQPDLIYRHC